MMTTPIVQYIVIRGDLGWPTGALIAQGAHVSVAAISTTLTREPTQQYLNALDKMHKIVLKAESEDQLQELVNKLKESQFDHYAWIEQPENILVAVASAPNDKTLLQPLFKAFKLFK